MKVRKPRVIS
jgi:hypothetical protein